MFVISIRGRWFQMWPQPMVYAIPYTDNGLVTLPNKQEQPKGACSNPLAHAHEFLGLMGFLVWSPN